MQISRLHVEVEGTFAAGGLDAGDALHLRWGLQVLVVLGFVDEEIVNAELIKDEPVILLVLGEKILQPFLALRLLLLDRLDEIAMCAGGALGDALDDELLI